MLKAGRTRRCALLFLGALLMRLAGLSGGNNGGIMRHKPTLAVFSAFFGLAAAGGCSQQTLDSAKQDAQHNATVVNQQAQQAERQARPQIDKFKLQSRVTTALTAANLPTTIHVRADADGVYLRGTVGSAGDKARAGQIARDTLGPDKKVHNQLQVSGE
jgi:osmotically-inducible protein OsmY